MTIITAPAVPREHSLLAAISQVLAQTTTADPADQELLDALRAYHQAISQHTALPLVDTDCVLSLLIPRRTAMTFDGEEILHAFGALFAVLSSVAIIVTSEERLPTAELIRFAQTELSNNHVQQH